MTNAPPSSLRCQVLKLAAPRRRTALVRAKSLTVVRRHGQGSGATSNHAVIASQSCVRGHGLSLEDVEAIFRCLVGLGVDRLHP